MMTSFLELNHVSITLHGTALFPPLSIRISGGETVTLMGESGCGKSTLLAWLCGTLPGAFHASGTAHLEGVALDSLEPEERRLGILFQDDLLFPHLSVAQNLAFALPPFIRSRKERTHQILLALAEAGLTGFEDRDPATLSGGQRARIALMRVLLSQPKALLLDEPFSKLDASTRRRFRDFVFQHAQARGLPTLLVTHDAQDAEGANGRIVDLLPGMTAALGS